MTTSNFAKVVGSYDYVMRSDVDAVLLPGLRHWVPEFGSAVGKGFMGSDFTQKRLEGIANKLGLTHHGIHGMQSTFYIRTNKITPFSQMVVNLSQHFYDEEFTPLICAEVERQGAHCSWPDWYRLVSTLYATDLAANHLLGEPDFKSAQVTEKLDHCATDCWSESLHTFGFLRASNLAARDVGQVHLLTTKLFLGNGFLHKESDGEFCGLANKTWPDFKIDRTSDWGASDESVDTYFMRVLAQSLPSICKTDSGLHM